MAAARDGFAWRMGAVLISVGMTCHLPACDGSTRTFNSSFAGFEATSSANEADASAPSRQTGQTPSAASTHTSDTMLQVTNLESSNSPVDTRVTLTSRIDAGAAISHEVDDASASSTRDEASRESGPAEAGPSRDAGEASAQNPTIDADCQEPGLSACDVNNATQKLVCSKGAWASNGSCDDGENCDPSSGRCKPVIRECAAAVPGQRLCGNDHQVLVCGANLVSMSIIEACLGACVLANGDAVCQPPVCGDGRTQSDELCDDGNQNNSDGCTELCAPPHCGDQFLNNSEDCEPAADNGKRACTSSCAWAPEVEAGNVSCARRTNGNLRCWGSNIHGQLGTGDSSDRGDEPEEALPAIDLGSERLAIAFGSSDRHACALLDNGAVKCWGANDEGQLGLGDSLARGDQPGEMGDDLPAVNLGTSSVPVALSVGAYHSCALFDEGSVKCWGDNEYGQLGQGDTRDRGRLSSDMGDSLLAVNLGAGRKALSVSAGAFHTCALLEDLSLKCWGDNRYGQLGLGNTSARGDHGGEMGSDLSPVDLGLQRAAAVSASYRSTCVLLDNGKVKCWGANTKGNLGLGDGRGRGDQSGEMGEALPAVDLGVERTARSISAYNFTVCVVLDNGEAKCWGDNADGQLGIGDVSDRGDEPNEMGDSLPAIDLGTNVKALSVSVGSQSTCAVLDNGSVKCWGVNNYGQLGLGDTASRGDEPGEMGESLPALPLW